MKKTALEIDLQSIAGPALAGGLLAFFLSPQEDRFKNALLWGGLAALGAQLLNQKGDLFGLFRRGPLDNLLEELDKYKGVLGLGAGAAFPEIREAMLKARGGKPLTTSELRDLATKATKSIEELLEKKLSAETAQKIAKRSAQVQYTPTPFVDQLKQFANDVAAAARNLGFQVQGGGGRNAPRHNFIVDPLQAFETAAKTEATERESIIKQLVEGIKQQEEAASQSKLEKHRAEIQKAIDEALGSVKGKSAREQITSLTSELEKTMKGMRGLPKPKIDPDAVIQEQAAAIPRSLAHRAGYATAGAVASSVLIPIVESLLEGVF